MAKKRTQLKVKKEKKLFKGHQKHKMKCKPSKHKNNIHSILQSILGIIKQ